MICEGCKKHAYFLEKCDYCGKAVCQSCVKSRKTIAKTKRYIICKQCWSSMQARMAFKRA